MILCKTVATLANKVRGQLKNSTEIQQKMLDVIEKMPDYCREKRLDNWEEEYTKVYNIMYGLLGSDPAEGSNEHAINEIFELGAYNLYAAFQTYKTKEYYQKMVTTLLQQGITIPDNLPVSDW
jgi:hypothetical protein